MSSLADNIKFYRKRAKLTQKELASKLGIAPTAVSAWELGRNMPLLGNIEHMAVLFGISKSQLIGGDSPSLSTSTLDDKILALSNELTEPRRNKWISYGDKLLDQQNTVENSKDTVDEPITYYTYNYYDQPASAGTGQYLNDVQVEQIELPVDIDADFVVPIYGDSMEPDYSSGDYIFVKPSVNLSDGDIGVFEYNGDAYIKQLIINKHDAFLHSLNDKYDDIPIDKNSDFRIIGEVVGKYRKNLEILSGDKNGIV